MYKKFTALGLVFCFLLSMLAYPVQASNINIKIDGQLCTFETGPQLVNNRVMVPVRLVVEHPSFGGEVFWDGTRRKIAINCQGKYLEFYIGSLKAVVDGNIYYFDTPPYIYQNRTYIPLRFFAEALGAKVFWDGSKREVAISFNSQQPKLVFAYYYYRAFDELKQNARLFTDVAFRWFETNGKGDLFYEYKDNYEEILKFTREAGIKSHASIALMNKDLLHELLTSSQNRKRLIDNIVYVVKRDGYNGVNIDFEFIDPADGPYFTTFLRELKNALGENIPLSVAVFARTGKEKWPVAYEYENIGKIADYVVVMAYDYSYATSAPGPVAPLWWVKEVAHYMTGLIPREKILLGVPTYGYDWSSAGGRATTVTLARLNQLKSKYKLTEYFDSLSLSPYYIYYDEYGNRHIIYLENRTSLEEKLKVAREYDLGGISFWRIGNGFTDLYQILQERGRS
ncbi:Predicted glycosyl hydrolase [Thermosyntropha lipolytica DSM 11003]|uniref:Predicted glycosyl hydrolase n=1 Tax=Thermosyntropha lipolytica DSM 11003 TaxID=1123382 RepID=A0A1M5JFC7_9FIRM|nr:glycosyl hydrolase family 18 protein [Thermosyntropha lipolytica]SHG39085.1 Predicted glycosyl hydrolase [Thermosyntropha lipolytica DSM 11003]